MKKHNLLLDIINVIVGVGMVIVLLAMYFIPNNRILWLAIFLLGGFINIANGFQTIRCKKKSSVGMSQIMIGILIIFLLIIFI